MTSFTDGAVGFPRGVQKFIRATESLLIDIISLIIPWASPLIPAYMAWASMSTRLDFPGWVSLAGAAVVELLGLATVNTAFEFWSFNQEKRKSDSKAPVILAVMVAVFYLAVVLTVNTMLDESPAVYRLAKALLSSLTIAGGIIIALRAGHARRLAELDAERIEARHDRQELRRLKIENPLALAKKNGHNIGVGKIPEANLQ